MSLLAAAFRATAQDGGTNPCFPVGERLAYNLYWGVVPVGYAEFSVEWFDPGGERMIRLRGRARSNRVIAAIYPIDDLVESIVDPATLLPRTYVQKLREGRYVRDDLMLYDHAARKAFWRSGISGAQRTIEIDGDTRDVLSFVYFMRTKGYAVGREETFRVLVEDKLYDLSVKGLAHETVRAGDFGPRECIKVEPQAKFGEIFVRKGRVHAWFSLDPRRVCLRMVGVLPVANVKAVLASVEGPGADAWAKAGGDAGIGRGK